MVIFFPAVNLSCLDSIADATVSLLWEISFEVKITLPILPLTDVTASELSTFCHTPSPATNQSPVLNVKPNLSPPFETIQYCPFWVGTNGNCGLLFSASHKVWNCKLPNNESSSSSNGTFPFSFKWA